MTTIETWLTILSIAIALLSIGELVLCRREMRAIDHFEAHYPMLAKASKSETHRMKTERGVQRSIWLGLLSWSWLATIALRSCL